MSNLQSRKNSAFVNNLDPTTSDVDFVAYFQKKYTGVTSGKIVRDLNGRSKGYGFINFIDSAIANRAIQDRNHLINGTIAVCKHASPKKKKQNLPKNFQKKEPKYMKELHVNNLNKSTTNQQLKEYFQKFGSVVNAYIIHDENKRSKGYGFVEFQSSASVDEVQESRPHKINDQEFQTVRSYPKGVPTHLKKPTTVLYVLNYENVDEENIEEYFSQFGDITMVSRKVKKPEDIKFMELQFDDYDAVDNICLADNHTINNCTITVTKYLGDDLGKWTDPGTGTVSTQNTTKPAANSRSNSVANTYVTKKSPSSTSINKSTTNTGRNPIQPTAPKLPAQDLYQVPYNPHFVNIQQPLYPNLQPPPPTTTNLLPSSTPTSTRTVISPASSVRRPSPVRRSTETNNRNNKDCHIL